MKLGATFRTNLIFFHKFSSSWWAADAFHKEICIVSDYFLVNVFCLTSNRDVHGAPSTKGPGNIPLQDQHLALAILLELAVQRGTLR